MYNKEYYFENIQRWVFQFNPYWEDPIENTPLKNDTEETCELLISYCNLLITKGKKIKERGNYEKYPQDIKDIIKQIIELVCDDRDLRHKILYTKIRGGLLEDPNKIYSREFDHHVEENGYLGFENNPFDHAKYVIDECQKLIEVVHSEAKTANLDKYLGKIYEFEGYESGSYVVQIKKINYNKKKKAFTFDGKVIEYCTENTNHGNGVLFYDAEDFPFNDLPYVDVDSEKEIDELLYDKKPKELKDAILQTHNAMIFGFENVFGITYNYNG